jgi:hypothetical protein
MTSIAFEELSKSTDFDCEPGACAAGVPWAFALIAIAIAADK